MTNFKHSLFISSSQLQKELGLSPAYFRTTIRQKSLPFTPKKISGTYFLTEEEYELFIDWYKQNSRPRKKLPVDNITQ